MYSKEIFVILIGLVLSNIVFNYIIREVKYKFNVIFFNVLFYLFFDCLFICVVCFSFKNIGFFLKNVFLLRVMC